MKKLFFLFTALLFSFSFSQTDTAQIVVPNRYNSAEAMTKPYVIFISADGFRYDYAKKYNAQNLLNLSENGVRADAMIPSFPSITFPNHWSLITSLYPSHHGLVDNEFYDYQRKDFYAMSNKDRAEDGSWYGGIPLWGLAEKQGVLSASMMWVGSASDAGGTRPTYYYHYHEKFSPEEKVEKVVHWLRLPEEKRPHFITLYFPEVDASGHKNGTEAEETGKAVHLIDDAVESLVAKVKTLGLKNVNFIFVSDHGMINVDTKNPIYIPEMLLNKEKFDFYNSNTLVRVVVKDTKDVKTVFRELRKDRSEKYKVVLDKRVPKYLHFSTKDDRYHRIGQILLVPKSPNIFLEKGKTTKTGKHGYDPRKTPEMKAAFFAWGDAFQTQLKIREFENVNVYPLIAHILNLNLSDPIDGKFQTLEKTLKK